MKKMYLTLLFTISLFTFCYSQWKAQGQGILPDHYGIYDVVAIDETTVWAIAIPVPNASTISTEPSIVLRSTDGGETWDTIVLNQFMGRNVDWLTALDDTTAWISMWQANGTKNIAKTMDGGVTWNEQVSIPGTPNELSAPALKFKSKQEGFYVHNAVLNGSGYTENGGETWDNALLPNPLPNEWYSLASSQNWFDVHGDTIWFGTSKRINRSTDGGVSWSSVALSSQGNAIVSSVAFDEVGTGLAIASMDADLFPNPSAFLLKTIIQKSENFGNTWTKIPDASFPLFHITDVPGCQNSQSTFFGVSGTIAWIDSTIQLPWASAFTTDGGNTWTKVDSFIPYHCISFASPTAGWAGRIGGFDYGPDKPALFKWEGIIPGCQPNAVTDESAFGITVSPNPFSTYLNIDIGNHRVESIEISSIQGQRLAVISGDMLNGYDFSGFPAGVYFLQILTEEGIITKKVIKN